ncbi:MAG: hypothetical protein NTY09_12350 [bacterium]|nr:hypothetical protein [bacterium]
MSKIIKTIAFTLVLAGLLAWGASTVAQVPSNTVNASVGNSKVEIVTSTEVTSMLTDDLSRIRPAGQ